MSIKVGLAFIIVWCGGVVSGTVCNHIKDFVGFFISFMIALPICTIFNLLIWKDKKDAIQKEKGYQ